MPRGIYNRTKAKPRKKYYRKPQVVAAAAEIRGISLQYRDHQDDMKRVWRADWPGDVFEIMTAEQFRQVQYVCARFSMSLTEADDLD